MTKERKHNRDDGSIAKKHKKDKKDRRKDKKNKKEKKDKKHKSSKHLSGHGGRDEIGSEEKSEIAQFKVDVQGSKLDAKTDSNNSNVSLLHASWEEIATKFGISKGILQTSENRPSLTESYAYELFGDKDTDSNPAKRQREKRENVAQRAIVRARSILAQREADSINASQNKNSSSGGGDSSSNNFMAEMANRFHSSNRK